MVEMGQGNGGPNQGNGLHLLRRACRRSASPPEHGPSCYPAKLMTPPISRDVATVIVLLVWLLAGCVTGFPTSIVKNPAGWEQLTSMCYSWSDTCKPIRVTGVAGDEEAWWFAARMKRSLVGASYGRQLVDQYVVGPRENCEATRLKVAQAGIPSAPCEGPIYFRRE